MTTLPSHPTNVYPMSVAEGFGDPEAGRSSGPVSSIPNRICLSFPLGVSSARQVRASIIRAMHAALIAAMSSSRSLAAAHDVARQVLIARTAAA